MEASFARAIVCLGIVATTAPECGGVAAPSSLDGDASADATGPDNAARDAPIADARPANSRDAGTTDAATACPRDAASEVVIVPTDSYGYYQVTSITIDSAAPAGRYSFVYAGPLDPTQSQTATVNLLRDCTLATSVVYPWQTTVGSGLSYTFRFASYFAITVTNAGGGTLNLWDMPQSIFDGTHVIVVP